MSAEMIAAAEPQGLEEEAGTPTVPVIPVAITAGVAMFALGAMCAAQWPDVALVAGLLALGAFLTSVSWGAALWWGR